MMNPWAPSALWAGLALIAALLGVWFKLSTKSLTTASTALPAVCAHRSDGFAGAHYALMMSTVPMFGSILAPFGLNHQIIRQTQYTFLFGTLFAVIPTVVANTFLLPRHQRR
jgi:hypothetical protein